MRKHSQIKKFVAGYTQEELDLISAEVDALLRETDKKIADGEYVMHGDLIVPKGTDVGGGFTYHVQQLMYEIEGGHSVAVNVILFTDFVKPKGPLEDNYAAHACMMYALKAFKQYYMRTQKLQLETDHDHPIQYENLFKTTARMYNVGPDYVAQHWPAVRQAFKMAFNEEIPPHIQRATGAILHDYLQ